MTGHPTKLTNNVRLIKELCHQTKQQNKTKPQKELMGRKPETTEKRKKFVIYKVFGYPFLYS